MAQDYDKFVGSEVEGSLAMELEFIYVHPDTMLPISVAPSDKLCGDEIIKFINERGVVEADREWRKDTVEVRPKGYWVGVKEAKIGIFQLFDEAVRAADHFGLMVIPIGRYPGERAGIYNDEAYDRIWNRYPSVRQGANFFGLHVHYGIKQLNEDAIRAIRRMNAVTGLLVGLFANSPCFNYEWESRRMIQFVQLPGVDFFNWDSSGSFDRFMNERLDEKTIERRSRLWSINRPSKFTLEVRSLDVLPLVQEAWAATGLLASLIALFLKNHDLDFTELSEFICRRNLEISSGHGLKDLSQDVWNPWRKGGETSLHQCYDDLFGYVEKEMSNEWAGEFDHLKGMVEGRTNGASRIRRWRNEGFDPRVESSKLLCREVEKLRPEIIEAIT